MQGGPRRRASVESAANHHMCQTRPKDAAVAATPIIRPVMLFLGTLFAPTEDRDQPGGHNDQQAP